MTEFLLFPFKNICWSENITEKTGIHLFLSFLNLPFNLNSKKWKQFSPNIESAFQLHKSWLKRCECFS